MTAQAQTAEPVEGRAWSNNGFRLHRVGFDARWYNDSGVGSYLKGLLRALAVTSRDFDLLVYENPENRVPGLDGLPVIRIPLKSTRYSLSGQWELRRRALADRLDVFHSPFYGIPIALPCPVVVTIHDLIPFMFSIYSWPKQQAVKMGYRLASRRAHHLIADSQVTANDIHRFLGVPEERVTVAHLGASCEVSQAESGVDEFALLKEKYGVCRPYFVVGSARNWRTKNLKTALEALESARNQTGIAFQTLVFGPRHGLDSAGPLDRWRLLSIRYCGYVPSRDLTLLFRNAYGFVTASRYEGFGLSVVEAMACGCAVVGSNAGALQEIAGAGAQLFEPFDHQGMAAALIELLGNPQTLARWRAAALRRAQDFSWAKTAAQTIAVYYRASQRPVLNTFRSTLQSLR